MNPRQERHIARWIHYPQHWDLAAYPTLADAIWEVIGGFQCSDPSHRDIHDEPYPWSGQERFDAVPLRVASLLRADVPLLTDEIEHAPTIFEPFPFPPVDDASDEMLDDFTKLEREIEHMEPRQAWVPAALALLKSLPVRIKEKLERDRQQLILDRLKSKRK